MVDPSDSTVVTVISGVSRGLLDQASACLVITYGAELGRRFLLDRPEMVIGRSRGCDIMLEQDSASRRHALIRFSGGRYSVQDMGSTNGTCVNDDSVSEAVLNDADELRLGRTVLRFLSGDEPEKRYRECLVAIAQTDGLTGAMRDEALLEVMSAECGRARRYQRWLGYVQIELGGWQAYSERAGRIYSDLRLRRIARKMASKLRVSDKLARRGEAGFTLLLPEADPQQTQQCIDRITELIEDELEDLRLRVGSCALMGKECVASELLAKAAKGIVLEAPEAELEG